jgi:hypothetical protein
MRWVGAGSLPLQQRHVPAQLRGFFGRTHEGDDPVAPLDETPADMLPDEARRTREQNSHRQLSAASQPAMVGQTSCSAFRPIKRSMWP